MSWGAVVRRRRVPRATATRTAATAGRLGRPPNLLPPSRPAGAGGHPELSTYRQGGEARHAAGAGAATAVESASVLRNTTLVTRQARGSASSSGRADRLGHDQWGWGGQLLLRLFPLATALALTHATHYGSCHQLISRAGHAGGRTPPHRDDPRPRPVSEVLMAFRSGDRCLDHGRGLDPAPRPESGVGRDVSRKRG